MITLDSKKWHALSHAYGKASDIPELIKLLEKHPEHTSYESEPYYTLWSALCHQGDTYSASIAALPHLVHCCEKSPDKAYWSMAQLVVCIEISRLEGRCTDDISDEHYRQAVSKFVQITQNMKNAQPSEYIDQVSRAALYASQGDWESADDVFMEN